MVSLPVISSTFFLTFLMMIGLFFFIRASVKDRTKQIQLEPQDSADILVKNLQDYLETRAYRLTSVDAQNKQVTFQGFVQPSPFLAVLLSLLALVGLSCLVLVLFLLAPSLNLVCWLLVLASPLAGVFYWRKAGRWEKILLQVAAQNNDLELVLVTGHRDELIQLQENMSVKVID